MAELDSRTPLRFIINNPTAAPTHRQVKHKNSKFKRVYNPYVFKKKNIISIFYFILFIMIAIFGRVL